MHSFFKILNNKYYRRRYTQLAEIFESSGANIFHIGATFMYNMVGNPTLDVLVISDDFPFTASGVSQKYFAHYEEMRCNFNSHLKILRVGDVFFYWGERKHRKELVSYKILTDYINLNPHIKHTLTEIKHRGDELAKRKLFNNTMPHALTWYEERKTRGPNPHDTYVLPIVGQEVVFLKNIITKPNIIVGEYTYYHDHSGAYNFENINVLHNHDPSTYLRIGKFCSIADGVRFIMPHANHSMEGSTYPFAIFSPECWGKKYEHAKPKKGHITIGNDVWIGRNVTIMPGVTVGDGAIIGTNSLVTKDVLPYTIVGGNPAAIIRKRFSDSTIQFYLKLQWWHWPIEEITQNVKEIAENNIAQLKKVDKL